MRAFFVVVPLAIAAACNPGEPIVCETAGDCGVEETCINGACESDPSSSSPSEEEPATDEDSILAVCEQGLLCGVFPQLDECMAQMGETLLRARQQSSAICQNAADAIRDTYDCMSAASCEEFVQGEGAPTCREFFAAAQELKNQCDGGEGEGEGEGEPEPEPVCDLAFAFETVDGPGLAVASASVDIAAPVLCAESDEPVTIQVQAAGMSMTDGRLTFDGVDVADAQLTDVRSDGETVVGNISACVPQGTEAFAVQVRIDGVNSAAACGFIARDQ